MLEGISGSVKPKTEYFFLSSAVLIIATMSYSSSRIRIEFLSINPTFSQSTLLIG